MGWPESKGELSCGRCISRNLNPVSDNIGSEFIEATGQPSEGLANRSTDFLICRQNPNWPEIIRSIYACIPISLRRKVVRLERASELCAKRAVPNPNT